MLLYEPLQNIIHFYKSNIYYFIIYWLYDNWDSSNFTMVVGSNVATTWNINVTSTGVLLVLHYKRLIKIKIRPVVAQWHSMTVKSIKVVGSIPTREREIFIYIYISISSLWCRGKARRWVPPFDTQCLQNSAEYGERSVLTLGLPCCVWETAWSWFFCTSK